MKIEEFFSKYPVFRFEQLMEVYGDKRAIKGESLRQAIQYYKRKGRLVSIRRGLFAVVPPHLKPNELYIDPYVLAGTVAADSVLSYHSALELHGLAHSVFQRYTFKSSHKIKSFPYNNDSYHPVHHAIFLQSPKLKKDFTETIYRNGVEIRLTNLASTFVDVLDRPDLCGGWEEIYQSLGGLILPYSEVIRYCLALESPALCAKVGFFLEHTQKNHLMDLDLLVQHRPKSPYYLTGHDSGPCEHIEKWNLIVPKKYLNKTWEEPNNDF